MNRKPIIGITPSPSDDTFDHGTFRRYSLSTTYTDAVQAAGGIPVILPESETDLQGILDMVDGLIFSGGSDLDPAIYGDTETHETTYGIDPERDSFELALIKLAIEQDKPILGICRGIQSINVALGGTLIQDIDDAQAENVGHRQQKLGKSMSDVSHTVTITDEASPLYNAIPQQEVLVNSYHHQVVKDPAPALRIAAVSTDGVIESLWHPGMRFGLAVQWHPEMLAAEHDSQAAIFRALVAASSRVPVPVN
jgi:putative glutamine amidotransferase